MKKKVVITIIVVVVLLILGISVGTMIYKNTHQPKDEWLNQYENISDEDYIFKDVSKSDWASEFILYLTQRDLMKADEEGYFHPDDAMTIREFYRLIIKVVLPRMNSQEWDDEELLAFLTEEGIREDDFTLEQFNSSLTNYDAAIILAKTDLNIREKEQVMDTINYSNERELNEIEKTLISHAISRGFFGRLFSQYFSSNTILKRAEIAEIIYLFLND